jgi:hypothetical protein
MSKPDISTFSTIAPLIIQEYERYLPNAFDDSMTILQKMNKIIKYCNDMGTLSNSVVTQWNSVMTWVMGDGLTADVNSKLDSMVADGTLDAIINQNVFASINNTLSLIKGTTLNPDFNTGTDLQKLQKAFDDAIASNGEKTIELKRLYDITGGTILINKGDVRYPVVVNGGTIKKTDAGFMFSGLADASDLYFNRVYFESVENAGTKVFNADALIRLHTNQCQFSNVDTVWFSNTRPAQSIRSKHDTITGGKGWAANLVLEVYDTTFDDLTLEHRENGLKIGTAHSVRVLNSVIEGNTGIGIQVLTDSTSLIIENNYFELNTGLDIDLSSMVNAKGVSIKKNVVMGTNTTFIKWGPQISHAMSELNWVASGQVHDASLTATGNLSSKRDYGAAADTVNNDGTIRYYDVVHTKTISSGFVKSFIGEFTRLAKQVTISQNGSSWKSYTVDFGEAIHTDDLVTIQLNLAPDTASTVFLGSYYKSGNTVIFWVKNEHTTSLNSSVATVTVLKPPYSPIG